MKITSFTIGERRTKPDRISIELIDSTGRRAGLAFFDAPAPDVAEKLAAAQRIVVEGGPQ
ncbi:MAG TPA: hypothetical protein VGG45_14890 [Terracidiphilus sp.]|jgi:hypothetical protein